MYSDPLQRVTVRRLNNVQKLLLTIEVFCNVMPYKVFLFNIGMDIATAYLSSALNKIVVSDVSAGEITSRRDVISQKTETYINTAMTSHVDAYICLSYINVRIEVHQKQFGMLIQE